MKYDKEIVLNEYANAGIDLECEHRFHPERDWRFDFRVVNAGQFMRVAIEVEGLNGRHQRTAGFLADLEKYSHAASLGWLIIRVPVKELCMSDTIELVRLTIANRQRELEEIRGG